MDHVILIVLYKAYHLLYELHLEWLCAELEEFLYVLTQENILYLVEKIVAIVIIILHFGLILLIIGNHGYI